MCSQIHHLPLEEAIRPETTIFRAFITSTERKDSDDTINTHYVFDKVTMVRGKSAAVITAGIYTQRIPVRRDANGKVSGYFSPILQASGSENVVKKGDEVFVFTELADGSNVYVTRIEPLENEAAVDALISAQATPKRVKK